MTLPFSEDLIFAPGSQIPSATLNRIQRCIVQGAHGTKTLILPGAIGQGSTEFNYQPTDFGHWAQSDPPPGEIDYPIPLHVGDRILAIRGYVYHIDGPIDMRAYR